MEQTRINIKNNNNLEHDEFTTQQKGCDGNEIKPK